jgi:hypothetical protein
VELELGLIAWKETSIEGDLVIGVVASVRIGIGFDIGSTEGDLVICLGITSKEGDLTISLGVVEVGAEFGDDFRLLGVRVGVEWDGFR